VGEDASDEWVEVGAEGALWKKLLTSIFHFEEAESVVATVLAVVEDDIADCLWMVLMSTMSLKRVLRLAEALMKLMACH
jgi:hypothetical protein